MSIRPFDWRDLPTLHRCRNESIFLHSSLVLTRGPMLLSRAILSSLAPGTGIHTAVSFNDGALGDLLIGQFIHPTGSQCAQLTFMTPEKALVSGQTLPLLEHFSGHARERGAFRLLADVDERSPAFEVLRQAGFAIYARQRIWRLAADSSGESQPTRWQHAGERDLTAVRSLYNNLIPGLVQQVEPFPAERMHGFVYRQDGEVLAYVELKYGPRGIWAQPFIHPDAEEAAHQLADLFLNLPHRRSRPIYVCVRSYQAWLELTVENLAAEASPRQAMMVKHLAAPQKAVRAYALPALEGGQTEATAPFAHSRAISNGRLPLNRV